MDQTQISFDSDITDADLMIAAGKLSNKLRVHVDLNRKKRVLILCGQFSIQQLREIGADVNLPWDKVRLSILPNRKV